MPGNLSAAVVSPQSTVLPKSLCTQFVEVYSIRRGLLLPHALPAVSRWDLGALSHNRYPQRPPRHARMAPGPPPDPCQRRYPLYLLADNGAGWAEALLPV